MGLHGLQIKLMDLQHMLAFLLQIDQDTQEMLRQLGMSNLPGIKMVPVSSAASLFWSGLDCMQHSA